MDAASAAPAARPIPCLPGLDHTLAFLADPYRFIARACDSVGTDVVLVRLMLQPTLCLRGADAARLFYGKDCFTRVQAAPAGVRATLFGKGGVQGLDGRDHVHRKRFFLQATSPARVASFTLLAARCWNDLAPLWEGAQEFSLYEGLQRLLMRTACAGAGVPLAPADEAPRTRDVAALFDQAAAGAVQHLRARMARRRTDEWLAGLVDASRTRAGVFPPGSIAQEAAQLRGPDGRLLPARTAAVELLNVLRPLVAVSVFGVLGAHAMHFHRRWREPLARGDPAVGRAFAQEVRRFYPFFPAVAARTRREFTWQGLRFPMGVRALLDLYGTNHDPRHWLEPLGFNPVRFLGMEPGTWKFVPQGGARAEDHHRCPGEELTVALVQRLLGLLAASRWQPAQQDLGIRMERVPALPGAGLRLEAFSAARAVAPRLTALEAYEYAAPGEHVMGWRLDRAQRSALLGRHPPRYARPVADHVTLKAHVHPYSALPHEAACEIVGHATDTRGVEAMVVRVGGTTERPDGGTYHITWSLEPGREARESNDVIAARGWRSVNPPLPVRLEPACFP